MRTSSHPHSGHTRREGRSLLRANSTAPQPSQALRTVLSLLWSCPQVYFSMRPLTGLPKWQSSHFIRPIITYKEQLSTNTLGRIVFSMLPSTQQPKPGEAPLRHRAPGSEPTSQLALDRLVSPRLETSNRTLALRYGPCEPRTSSAQSDAHRGQSSTRHR